MLSDLTDITEHHGINHLQFLDTWMEEGFSIFFIEKKYEMFHIPGFAGELWRTGPSCSQDM